MTLRIVAIHEKGTPNQEYVELKADDACNLTNYMIADTTYTGENSISNKVRNTHWFAPKEIAKGDFVFLHTGTGTNSSFANKAGTTTHKLYWGLKKTVWNDDGDCAVLFNLKTWKTVKA